MACLLRTESLTLNCTHQLPSPISLSVILCDVTRGIWWSCCSTILTVASLLFESKISRACLFSPPLSWFMFIFSAVDCGNPQPLQNGSIVGNKTVYPNSVTHRCDEGFILHGSSRITCQTNGTWSKTSSYCEGKFYQLNPIISCSIWVQPRHCSILTWTSVFYFGCAGSLKLTFFGIF